MQFSSVSEPPTVVWLIPVGRWTTVLEPLFYMTGCRSILEDNVLFYFVQAILECLDVVEAAVVGVPDKLKGSVPLGLCVLKHGKSFV